MTHIKFRLLLCEEMNEQFESIFIEHWDKHPFNYGALVFKASHHGSPFYKRISTKGQAFLSQNTKLVGIFPDSYSNIIIDIHEFLKQTGDGSLRFIHLK